MEGSQGPTSVGDALQGTEVLVPQPGDDDFDPTVPQPGDDGYEEWLASQAPPMRPSERIDAAEQLREPPEPSQRDLSEEQVHGPVLHYAVEPGLAVALLGYLGQMPHDEVRHLIDGLRVAKAIYPETAESSGLEEVDPGGERG